MGQGQHRPASEQMPREDSVCTVTIERDEALVVPDLEVDDRFNASPTLMGSGLRFYAGQPLHAGEHRVGVLCVMGYEEREMGDAELRLLRILADWVEAELATENEMHRAALLQRALRPRSVIRLAGLRGRRPLRHRPARRRRLLRLVHGHATRCTSSPATSWARASARR